jgi:hypothetical protein
MINISINVTKILKEHMKTVQSGVYLDLFLFENRDGKDRYGNDGIVFQSVSKEAREAKIQGPILGNFKYVAKATKPAIEAAPKPPNRPVGDEFDDVPF